jgi:hypothetical protein
MIKTAVINLLESPAFFIRFCEKSRDIFLLKIVNPLSNDERFGII